MAQKWVMLFLYLCESNFHVIVNTAIIEIVILTGIFKPFTLSAAFGLIAILLLLCCSALASGSEMAFFSLSPTQIHEIKSRKSTNDLRIIKILEKPKRLLATILIFNNFVNIAIVIISTFLTQKLFDFSGFQILGFVFQFVVITALILFIGEITPKILASQHPIKFAYAMSGIMPALIQLFYPLSSILVHSTNFLERRVEKKGHSISLNELNEVIEIASNSETQEQEKNILKGIVKFGDLEVKEVMRSRVDVTAVEESTTFSELLNIVLDSGYSRLPVYKETLDQITGLLYIKDLLPMLGRNDNYHWQGLIRPALFIPENKGINDLLILFKEKKIHLALVVDEFGGTSGLVTLEDIIEEIVGEINDEYDDEPMETTYTKINENTYLFEAKTSINDFIKITNCDSRIFEDLEGGFDSLAGFVLEVIGKMPVKNEVVSYKNLSIRIESVDSRRIKQLKITINS